MNGIAVVKIQARKYRGRGDYYFISVPKDIVEELNCRKGDKFLVRVLELEIDSIKRKALVYYRP